MATESNNENKNNSNNDRPFRLLGVWAHPDDESYLSAGLMARISDAGGEVTVLTATLGERGFPEDDPRPLSELATFREAEMRDAMSICGVGDVRFMRWPDGAVGSIPEQLAVRRIAAVILDVQPDLIITFGPDGVTGHPDHVAISRATTAAWRSTGVGDLLYAATPTTWLDEYRDLHNSLGVWMTEEPEGTPPEHLADQLVLNDSELARKRMVLAAHESQTAPLAQVMGEEVYREWYRKESFRVPSNAEIEALPKFALPEDDYLWSNAWVALTRELATAA
ncbi:MAG: PIG-L deacetylase family protein [Acidimicrobiales bacterium]